MSLQQQQPASMRVLEGQMRTMNVLGNKENATVKLSSFCFLFFLDRYKNLFFDSLLDRRPSASEVFCHQRPFFFVFFVFFVFHHCRRIVFCLCCLQGYLCAPEDSSSFQQHHQLYQRQAHLAQHYHHPLYDGDLCFNLSKACDLHIPGHLILTATSAAAAAW